MDNMEPIVSIDKEEESFSQSLGNFLAGELNPMYIIDDMWKGLKKYFGFVFIIITLTACALFFVMRHNYRPQYQAYRSFYIYTRTAYGYSNSYYNKTAAKQMSSTFPYILTSGALQKIIMEELGYTGSLPGKITAESLGGNAVFTIRVTAEDPEVAYNILDSAVKNYPQVAEYIIGETKLEEIDDSGIPVKVINPPNYRKAVLMGILLGMVLSVMFLFFYAITRRNVRGERDLRMHLSIPYLGGIPHINVMRRTKTTGFLLLDSKEVNSAFGECMRSIRTKFLRETEGKKVQKIIITSASVAEGKTTCSVNLAISLARHGERVILIDGDLRNPSIAKAMGMENTLIGTVDVLTGRISARDAL